MTSPRLSCAQTRPLPFLSTEFTPATICASVTTPASRPARLRGSLSAAAAVMGPRLKPAGQVLAGLPAAWLAPGTAAAMTNPAVIAVRNRIIRDIVAPVPAARASRADPDAQGA